MSLLYYLDAREDRIAIICGNANLLACRNLVVSRPTDCFTWHGPPLRCPRITPAHDRRCSVVSRCRSDSSICTVCAPHHTAARELLVPTTAPRRQVVAELAGPHRPQCVPPPQQSPYEMHAEHVSRMFIPETHDLRRDYLVN